jgi:kumamolisin
MEREIIVKIVRHTLQAAAFAVAIPALLTASAAWADTFGNVPVQPGAASAKGRVLIPDSSIEKPGDRGQRAHTNYLIFAPKGRSGPSISPDLTEEESPASLACVYKQVTQSNGCNPAVVTKVPTSGSQVIAIVDAFHLPNALSDLQSFSSTFGLAAPNLQVVFCNASSCGVATAPPVNSSWTLESALDIEAAHAMAPAAKIVLVEGLSASFANLNLAIDDAANRANAAGGGEVSMSFGASEFGGETAFDIHFQKPKVVYLASSGDAHAVFWPAVSPFVVGIGGTTINRSGTGAFTSESAWVDTGGGLSTVYSRPTYQNGVSSVVGTHRGVPDVAADADPNSGFPVLCTTCGGWFQVGGTSLSSPLMAGMMNVAATKAGIFASSGTKELTHLYNRLGVATKFFDVTAGTCPGDSAAVGWDKCTGIGTPRGTKALK